MTKRFELRYVLDVTHPSGGTSRFWSLTRDRCYELADHYLRLGDDCSAHDDDYGHPLDLDAESRT